MQVIFVVKEWRNSNLEIVRRDDAADGSFVSGSVFHGSVFLEKEDEENIREFLEKGYYPVLLMNRP